MTRYAPLQTWTTGACRIIADAGVFPLFTQLLSGLAHWYSGGYSSVATCMLSRVRGTQKCAARMAIAEKFLGLIILVM